MGRFGKRIPGFCMSRVSTRVRVSAHRKPVSKAGQEFQFPSTLEKVFDDVQAKLSPGSAAFSRKIMIVVDLSFEAKSAVQWALSHTVQNHDSIVLLYITKSSEKDEPTTEVNSRGHELLLSMENLCNTKKPEVQTEVVMVEGKKKGETIVEEAKKQGVSLLVLGQRKRSMKWHRLLLWWTGMKSSGKVVDYCIENSSCMTVAVRRKSKRAGGYLITTKRHKDFWLLA